MIRNKLLRIILSVLILCLILTPCVLSVGASEVEDYLKGTSPRFSAVNIVRENSDTGYCIYVKDDEDLLTDTERSYLGISVYELTEYGDAIFWTCSVSEEEQKQQLKKWQDGDDGKMLSTCIIVLNFETGYIEMFTGGALYHKVSKDQLQEITDQITPYVNNEEYYACAANGFLLALAQVTGEAMAEPATAPPADSSEDKPISADEAVRYINPETGYEVMILDSADLLSDSEEGDLVIEMQPITEYGNIIFWSTNERAPDAEIQAREKRYSYYGYDSAGILAFNMANRKITYHTDGAMAEGVSASDARSITDNISHYASEGDYYDCAKEGFYQVLTRLRGQAIAEPMKYTSAVVIALMLAFVIVVGLVFGVFNPLSKKNKRPAILFGQGSLLANQPNIRKTGTTTRMWITILWILLSSIGRGGGGSGGSGGGGGGPSGGGHGGSSSF